MRRVNRGYAVSRIFRTSNDAPRASNSSAKSRFSSAFAWARPTVLTTRRAYRSGEAQQSGTASTSRTQHLIGLECRSRPFQALRCEKLECRLLEPRQIVGLELARRATAERNTHAHVLRKLLPIAAHIVKCKLPLNG